MKKKSAFIGLLVSFLFFSLPFSVFAKDIVILAQFPMSGPVGALPEFGWGFIDGMKWVNDEGGGVNGKKIDWYMEDMRYSPAVEVSNFTKYATEHSRDEFLMASGYITGGLKALIKKVNEEEKIPWLDGSYSSEVFGESGGPSKYPYYYSLGATYEHQIKALIRWAKQNHEEEGAPRIGFVYSPTSWGRDGTPGGIDYAKELGFEVVAEIEYPYSATSAMNECRTLRRNKAQYVIIHGYSSASGCVSIFFKTAKKLLKDARLMGTHYTTGRIPILAMQKAYDGYVGVSCRPASDAVPRSATKMDNAMVKMTHEFAKKYRPEAYAKGPQEKGAIKDMFLYMEGITYALMFQKALTEADNAGNLTREGVKKVLDELVWDFKGLFGGKTFSYASHTVPMMRIYQAHVKMVDMKGKEVPTGHLEPVSDWINAQKTEW
jgi:branched-chain amino acid transport system substrate-binding protein